VTSSRLESARISVRFAIYRLKIIGERDFIIIGKELEIRRALSRSHHM
jgi:hypothetical protein